jgi:hypothetical protein
MIPIGNKSRIPFPKPISTKEQRVLSILPLETSSSSKQIRNQLHTTPTHFLFEGLDRLSQHIFDEIKV